MFRYNNVNDLAMAENDVILTNKDLIGEIEAINQYSEHIMATDNKMVITTLTSIRKEEQVHFGELLALLYKLEPEFKVQVEKGMNEVSTKW
jgi:rubrerythrin